jgi:hydrogenase maturation protease
MKESKTSMLIIGIGNAGRQDDGLGWAFLDAIKDQVSEDVELVYRYQLNIEDAELISKADQVIFVDARKANDQKAFHFETCIPKETYEFTTHALGPEVVVALCNNLYNTQPQAHLLTISGKNWELEEGLSDLAKVNLSKAVKFFSQELITSLSPGTIHN